MKIEINVSVTKSSPEIIKAIEIIADGLSVDNLKKVAEKIKQNPEKVNNKLPTGLKFI